MQYKSMFGHETLQILPENGIRYKLSKKKLNQSSSKALPLHLRMTYKDEAIAAPLSTIEQYQSQIQLAQMSERTRNNAVNGNTQIE
jgi:hypothetical protein